MSGIGGSLRRRVWTAVAVVPDGQGLHILLDGKPLRLPGGAALRLQMPALAEAVAEEWRHAGGGMVGGVFGAEGLGLTRLAGTMQDRVAPYRASVIATLLAHADGDLLCYRATHPASLVERQQAAWQPWLDWCARTHGAALQVTSGIMPLAQPPLAVAALERALLSQDDAALTALGVLVPAMGSLVLGLAVAGLALPASEASRLALLDELHQLEHWGADVEATERHALLAQEIEEAAEFLVLCHGAR